MSANAETHKDLWVALKGGGNNFGIVTRFDLRVFEQGQLWGVKIFYFQPSFLFNTLYILKALRAPRDPVVNSMAKTIQRILELTNGQLLHSQDELGRTPLSHAAWRGSEDIMHVLLGHTGCQVDLKDNGGLAPIDYAFECE